MLNDVHSIIDRAIQSNIYTVMTDCPHREKLGWLEQTHLVFEPVTRGYDIQGFGAGIVRTMLDAQHSTGLEPDIAPEFEIFSPSVLSGGLLDEPNWGNAVVILPLQLYQTYGSLNLLEEAYTSMGNYVDYLAAKANNSILDYGLGDWIAFDTSTPKGITATFGFYQALNGMQTISAALGHTSDSEKYAAMISSLLTSFQSRFINTTNGGYNYGSASQASNAMALDIGVVPSEYQAIVSQNIVDSIAANGNHLSVGEIALPSLFRVLQAAGHNDILYQLVTIPTSPSYAYQVLHGATSLTENWDGPTNQCAGCNSLNHFMLGYADQWLNQLCGVSQYTDSVTWQTINYNPILVTNLTSASCSYRSPRGLASASWTRFADHFNYTLTVPVGATGIVALDLTTLGFNKVTERGIILTSQSRGNGIIAVTSVNGTMTVQLGSGGYEFIASKPPTYNG